MGDYLRGASIRAVPTGTHSYWRSYYQVMTNPPTHHYIDSLNISVTSITYRSGISNISSIENQ